MAQPLRLSIVASLDAKGVSAGAAETRREIESVADSAGKAASMTRLMAAANDEAAAAQRRAIDAARGRSAAEIELQQSIGRMIGIRPMLDDAGMGRRTADIAAYGEALDDLRAKYNPLFAAERERERSITAISQALRLGAISQDEHAVAVGRANTVYQQQVAAIAANDVMLVRSAQSTRLQAHEVGNLSFQLTDMAVMLASGQSPWLMMVQQGSQVSQIMGNRGLGSILPALASGIGAMVNPTMLALAAVTALGYGASAAFGAMQSDIVQVDKLVSDHEDTIRRIKAAWGDAATGLQPYARESRAVLDLVMRVAADNRRTALRDLTPGALAGITSAVNVSDFGGARAFRQSDTFRVLREEIDALNKAAANGTPDFVSFQRRMVELERSDPSPKVRALAAAAIEATKEVADLQRSLPEAQNELDGIGGAAERAAKRIDTFQEALRRLGSGNRSLSDRDQALRDYAAAQGSASGREERDDAYTAYQDRLRRIENEEAGALVPTPTRRPNLEDSLPSGRDLIASQREQLETLRLEAMLVTSSTATRERATAAMRAEQEIRRLGIDSAGEEAEAIRANATAIADQTSALERNEDAWRKSQSAAESMIDSLIDRLSSGDIEGALEGLARDLSKELLGLGVGNPLKNLRDGGDRPELRDFGGPLGFLGSLVGRRPATLTPTIAETGGGLLGMLGVDKPGAEAIRVQEASPVAGNSVAAQAWNFFAGKGLAEHQVAGILGNVKAESAFNPKAIGDGGNAFGLFQHNDRRWKLFQHLGGMENLGDVRGQLEFAWKELQGPERRALDALLGSRNVREATAAFAGFERPSGFSWENPEGAHNFSGRLRGAEEALAKFTGGAGAAVRNVDAMATSSVAAKEGIGALGQGAGQLGQNLARYFPAAPGAPAGGGIGGWLSGLLGGGAPSMASMSAFSPLAAAAISAGRGGLYEVGGFTGWGNPKDAAGLVHREEYVFSAPAVRAIGVGNLDAMHRAAKHGYAEGGHAMPDSWRAPVGGPGGSGGGSGQPSLSVNLINQTSEPMRAERRRVPDGRGGWRDDVILKRAAIDAVTGPEGRTAMGATYGMQATMPEL